MHTNRPSIISAMLLCCGALATTIAIADEPSVPSEKSTSTDIQRRVEDGAQTYSHFATGDIVNNRPTSSHRWPPALYQEQARLLVDLRAWAEHAEAMRSLISHADAKVRTLAPGALFVHEDPQDLPLIASLVNDKMSRTSSGYCRKSTRCGTGPPPSLLQAGRKPPILRGIPPPSTRIVTVGVSP